MSLLPIPISSDKSVFSGYNESAKYRSSSFEGRANNEWANVQSKAGPMYVPDPSATMDSTTLQINLQKIEKNIAHYSQQPVPQNLADLYKKEVEGRGQPISKVVSGIRSFLEKKRQAYISYINSISTGSPVNDIEEVDMPGAGTPDLDSAKNSPAPEQDSPGLDKKKIIVGASIILVLVVAGVIIYKKVKK